MFKQTESHDLNIEYLNMEFRSSYDNGYKQLCADIYARMGCNALNYKQ